MALDVQSLTWHMSGVAIAGDPQPDPNASLGGYWASTRLDDAESTITSATNARLFIDTAQIGQDHTGKVILFVNGPNEGQAVEITDFNTSTGEFECELGFTNTPGVGDRYRLYVANNIFSAYTSTLADADQAIYRLVFCQNTTGVTLTQPRVYITTAYGKPGPFLLEVAYGAAASAASPDIDYISSQTEEPDIVGGDLQFTHTTRPQDWRREFSYISAKWTPNLHIPSVNWSLQNNWKRPLWMRLRLADPTVIPPTMEKAIFIVTLESIETGGDPDPIATRFCVVAGMQTNEQVVVASERKLRTFGGGRINVDVTDQATGLPVAERRASMELVAPSPGTLNQPYTTVTDANGRISAIYLSPEDEGEVGETVEIKAKVN